MDSFGAAVTRIAGMLGGQGAPGAEGRRPRPVDLSFLQDIQARMDAMYAGRMEKWERDRPYREMAERAHKAALLRRAAELGEAAGDVTAAIMNCALFEPPKPPRRIW